MNLPGYVCRFNQALNNRLRDLLKPPKIFQRRLKFIGEFGVLGVLPGFAKPPDVAPQLRVLVGKIGVELFEAAGE
jgi:hypothetical protein